MDNKYELGKQAGNSDVAANKPERYCRFDGKLVEYTNTGFIPVTEENQLFAIGYLAVYWK